MAITDGMKSITEGIIASHESRASSARDRRDEVNKLIDNTRKTMRNFASDRAHMGAGQAKALADYAETLKSGVADLRKATHVIMKGFRKDHAAMAAGIREKAGALRETLAQGEADRMKNFKGMMADMRDVIKRIIKTNVAGKMSEFRAERSETGRKLRKDLSKYAADISKDTGAVLDGARELVHGFSRERAKMSTEWRGMAASLAKPAGAGPGSKAARQAAADAGLTVVKKNKKKGRNKKAKKNR